MKGWIYIISNPAMPGLIKVGHSTKDPELRARELNHTGSPHPYIVEYEMLIEEPFRVEQQVHKALVSVREGKEWFRCLAEEAVAVIQRVTEGKAINETFKRVERERAERIRREQKEAECRQEEINGLISKQIETVRSKYRDAFAAEEHFKKYPFWVYWIGCAIFVAVVMAMPSLKVSDSAIFWLAIIGGGVSAYFVNGHAESRIKRSSEYQTYINKRDTELEEAKRIIIYCPQCHQALRFGVHRLLSSGKGIWSCPKCNSSVHPLEA